METEMQETYKRKQDPVLLVIAITHFLLAFFLGTNLYQNIVLINNSNLHIIAHILYVIIVAPFILLNLTAGIYLIQGKPIGWWSSGIYFVSEIIVKVVLALGSLASILRQYQFGMTDIVDIFLDDLKIYTYEVIIMIIALFYLFQSNKIEYFKIKKSRKFCIMIFVVIGLSSLLFKLLLSVLDF